MGVEKAALLFAGRSSERNMIGRLPEGTTPSGLSYEEWSSFEPVHKRALLVGEDRRRLEARERSRRKERDAARQQVALLQAEIGKMTDRIENQQQSLAALKNSRSAPTDPYDIQAKVLVRTLLGKVRRRLMR